jgi:hypothetical protein
VSISVSSQLGSTDPLNAIAAFTLAFTNVFPRGRPGGEAADFGEAMTNYRLSLPPRDTPERLPEALLLRSPYISKYMHGSYTHHDQHSHQHNAPPPPPAPPHSSSSSGSGSPLPGCSLPPPLSSHHKPTVSPLKPHSHPALCTSSSGSPAAPAAPGSASP